MVKQKKKKIQRELLITYFCLTNKVQKGDVGVYTRLSRLSKKRCVWLNICTENGTGPGSSVERDGRAHTSTVTRMSARRPVRGVVIRRRAGAAPPPGLPPLPPPTNKGRTPSSNPGFLYHIWKCSRRGRGNPSRARALPPPPTLPRRRGALCHLARMMMMRRGGSSSSPPPDNLATLADIPRRVSEKEIEDTSASPFSSNLSVCIYICARERATRRWRRQIFLRRGSVCIYLRVRAESARFIRDDDFTRGRAGFFFKPESEIFECGVCSAVFIGVDWSKCWICGDRSFQL